MRASLPDRLALVLAGLMLSLPFLLPWHSLPIPSFDSEVLAFLLGLMACLCASLAALARHEALAVPRIACAPLALAGVALWQLASGQLVYAANGAMLLLFLLWALCLMLLGQALAQRFDPITLHRHLAGFLLAGGLVNAVFGLLQYFGAWQWWPGLICEPMSVSEFGVYGNLAQQNHFATHVALALAAACQLRLSRHLALGPWLIGSMLLLAALFLSGSRSSMLYLVWLALLVWHWKRSQAAPDSVTNGAGATSMRQRWGRKTRAAMLAGALLVLVLILWLTFGPALPQLQRLTRFAGAIGSRGFLWQHAWHMFISHPLSGIGFDSFAFNLIGQLDASNRWGVDQYAHNLLLQLLANAGWPGLLAVLLPLILFIRRQWGQPNSAQQMGVRAMLGMLAIHSLLEQPLYFSYFLGVAALLLGSSDTLPWRMALHRSGKIGAAIVLAGGLLLLAQTRLDYERIEGTFYSQRYFVGAEQASARQQWVRQRATDSLTGSLYTPLLQLVAPYDFVANEAPVTAKLAFNWRVLRYAPIAETEFRHAALLAEAGQVAAAEQQFRRAALAYPGEAASYAERFAALAKQDPASYGKVAEYARNLLPTLVIQPQ
jgi:O-antigen ligase